MWKQALIKLEGNTPDLSLHILRALCPLGLSQTSQLVELSWLLYCLQHIREVQVCSLGTSEKLLRPKQMLNFNLPSNTKCTEAYWGKRPRDMQKSLYPSRQGKLCVAGCCWSASNTAASVSIRKHINYSSAHRLPPSPCWSMSHRTSCHKQLSQQRWKLIKLKLVTCRLVAKWLQLWSLEGGGYWCTDGKEWATVLPGETDSM